MEQDIGVQAGQLPTKKRLRFRDDDDLALLREVLSLNPFKNTNLWEDVQEHVLLLTQKNFCIKTLRDHLHLLINMWIEKNKILKDRSGIEETYSEKNQLCYNIYQMMTEHAIVNCTPKKRKTINLGKINRDKCAKNAAAEVITKENAIPDAIYFPEDICTNKIEIVEENTMKIPLEHSYSSGKNDIAVAREVLLPESTSKRNATNMASTSGRKKILQRVRTRLRKTSNQRLGLEYLENFDVQQNELKKTEQKQLQEKIEIEREKIALENRRLTLEEQKFTLQEFERKKYLEILEKKIEDDKVEREKLLQIIERQEKLINILLLKKSD